MNSIPLGDSAQHMVIVHISAELPLHALYTHIYLNQWRMETLLQNLQLEYLDILYLIMLLPTELTASCV